MDKMNIDELLESGAHYGHPVSKWDPHFKPFIATKKNGIYILGLHLIDNEKKIEGGFNFKENIKYIFKIVV